MAKGSDLVEVTIETLLGSKYIFPDMPRGMLDNVITKSGWDKVGRLVLVNVSATCLSMESRIVKTVSYEGEVKWKNAALPELPDPG